MIRIIHIITGLGSGGAENMLYKLLKYSDSKKYYHEVISLIDEGVIGEKIRDLGVNVHSLNISKMNIIKVFLDARRMCKDFEIISTWLYHADIFGFIVAKLLLKKKIVWNIRHSNLDKNANKKLTLVIVRINSLLSRFVDCITYNSNKAYETHNMIGYINNEHNIIPNGFELDKFKFSSDSRKERRIQLDVNDQEKMIITVGRWDIQKDYYTLFKAMNELALKNFNFKLCIVGTNLDYFNEELVKLVNNSNLRDNIMLLGRREDIPELLSAADIYLSTSLGESFSNAIGEAMACELPCIVTDVGDSSIMVGKFGAVVPPGNYLMMAEKVHIYLSDDKLGRNIELRNRIINYYEIKKIVREIEDLVFERLMKGDKNEKK